MRWRVRKPVFIPFVLFLVGALLGGCATPTFRAPPQFQARMERLKTLAMIPPNIKVYSLTAGGVKEERDDWSALAYEGIMQAFDAHLTGNTDFVFVPFESAATLPPPQADTGWTQLEETKALYKAVSASIYLHTYHPEQTFPQKMTSFDYTLGPQVKDLAHQAGADALLFVDAVDHVSTGGRKALMVLGLLAGAAVGAATGVFVGAAPGSGVTLISAALVDGRSGDLLWYNIHAASGGYDLRDPRSCADLVQALLKDFPGTHQASPKG